MFDNLKSAIQDILQGRVAPVDRRAAIADMKRALVSAKLGVSDLREGVDITRQRLETERKSLETVMRRKALAASVPDLETVAIAEKFEAQHTQRIAVLEQKLAAQEAELGMVETDYDEMLKALKAADRGAGSGLNAESLGPTDADLGLPDDEGLNAQLDALKRQSRRGDADAAAEARLEELKRRMGQQPPE